MIGVKKLGATQVKGDVEITKYQAHGGGKILDYYSTRINGSSKFLNGLTVIVENGKGTLSYAQSLDGKKLPPELLKVIVDDLGKRHVKTLKTFNDGSELADDMLDIKSEPTIKSWKQKLQDESIIKN